MYLQAVLVGPECGAWKLTEMVVSNSRQQLTQHFVCRQHLGTKGGKGAALLPAVPPGAVVYGTGDTAVLLSAVRPNPAAASCPPLAQAGNIICQDDPQKMGLSACSYVVLENAVTDH